MDFQGNDLTAALKTLELSDVLKRCKSSADNSRSVASAAGVETPLSVLSDIRKMTADTNVMLNSLDSKFSAIVELMTEQKNEQRLLLTKLLEHQNTNTRIMQSVEPSEYGTHVISSTGSTNATYYYGQWPVKNAPALLGCILYHLDVLFSSHSSANPDEVDVSYMEPKAWSSLVSLLIQSIENSKLSLRLPKPTDNDFKRAADIVCSKYSGQSPQISAVHVRSLVGTCSEVMSTVQVIIEYCTKCRAVLSPARLKRLASTHYPFIDDNEELIVDPTRVKIASLPDAMHQEYNALKAEQKKRFIRSVYSGATAPVALKHAKVSSV